MPYTQDKFSCARQQEKGIFWDFQMEFVSKHDIRQNQKILNVGRSYHDGNNQKRRFCRREVKEDI